MKTSRMIDPCADAMMTVKPRPPEAVLPTRPDHRQFEGLRAGSDSALVHGSDLNNDNGEQRL